MPTAIAGQVVTGNILQIERKVDIPNHLIWKRPEIDPLVKLTAGRNAKGLPIKKRACINPKFEIVEKEPHTIWTAINGAKTTGDVVITVDDASFIKATHIVKYIPSGELMRVDSKSTNDLTVIRAHGTTAAGTLADNKPILNLGTMSEEGSALPAALTIKNRQRTNYTCIKRWPVDYSGTMEKSALHHGSKKQELRREALFEVRRETERIFLWSEPYEDLTGGPNSKPIRETGGLDYWITSGGGTVSDVSGTLTKNEFMTFRRNTGDFGGRTKVGLFCGVLIQGISEVWKDGKLEMRPNDLVYNLDVVEWIDAFGRLLILWHQEFTNSADGDLTGYGDVNYVVDTRHLAYRYLTDRDLALHENVLSTGVDGTTDEYRAEIGFYIEIPEAHGKLHNVTSVSN